MQGIAPELLQTILGLSATAATAGVVLGFLLWLFGWWGHRFWIVLFTTVAAGIYGMKSGHASGVAPIVAGLLLAISAGMMALALARVVAFMAGGLAICLVMQWLFPSWEERLLWFLGGGLAGLVLFRLWMMTLTSLAGTLMMGYFGLCLLDTLGKMNAQLWVEQRTTMLNWACAGVTLLGVLAQFLVERWRKRFNRHREEQAHLKQAQMELDQRRGRAWWQWGSSSKKAA
jgi:MFS family permease